MEGSSGASRRPTRSTRTPPAGIPPPPVSARWRVGRPYDPEPRREETRSRLAIALVALLFLVATLLIVFTAAALLSIEEAKDLAATVLSPVVAVTGTALGFYFGGHRRGN
jgi:hypothetical protein